MTKPKGLLLLKGLLDSASDAIVAVNNKTEIVLFNKQAERILGYTESEVMGTSALNLLPSRYRKVTTKFSWLYYNKLHNQLKAENRVFLGLKKNGEEFPVNFSLSEFKTGQTQLIVCSFRDITETIKAKSQLKESETKYRQIVEGSHELIQSVSTDGKILFANKAWKKTLGYTDDDLKTLNIHNIVAEESRLQCIAGFNKVMKGQAVEGLDLVFLTKDGKRIYTEGNTTPQLEAGKVVATQGFFRDVTAKKMVDLALQETKANLGSLFQSSTIGYLMLDTHMRIIAYNKMMKKWVLDETGYNLQEGLKYTDLLSGERKRRASAAFVRALNGERIEYEAEGNDVDLYKYWFYININPMLQNEKNIIGLSITCLDITEKKKAEIELQKTSTDVIQRNKDLEQFAYIVSHNLRAPLSNILGAATVLQYKDLPEKDRDHLLDGIYSAVQKLDEVVIDLNNILQVNQNISENRQTVSFQSLVNDIKTSIFTLIETEQVQVITNFREVDTFFTLKSYIYSIFYNLITNSIKYRKANIAPIINITSKNIDNQIVLTFTDNGMGIDIERYKNKIFGLYKRFHDNAEGKGLGLFMVKTQVETLGGQIDIASKVGQGTTFTITFKQPE